MKLEHKNMGVQFWYDNTNVIISMNVTEKKNIEILNVDSGAHWGFKGFKLLPPKNLFF